MANRRTQMILATSVLVLVICAALIALRGDEMNWIRKHSTKEIVHTPFGGGGAIEEHSFYFKDGIPDDLLREISEYNKNNTVTVSHGQFVTRMTPINVSNSANLVNFQRSLVGESWLSAKWQQLRRSLGF